MKVDGRREGRPDTLTQSPDLMPSVFAYPTLPTAAVWVDGDGLGGAIWIAGRAHPVVLILRERGITEKREMNEMIKRTERKHKKGKCNRKGTEESFRCESDARTGRGGGGVVRRGVRGQRVLMKVLRLRHNSHWWRGRGGRASGLWTRRRLQRRSVYLFICV